MAFEKAPTDPKSTEQSVLELIPNVVMFLFFGLKVHLSWVLNKIISVCSRKVLGNTDQSWEKLGKKLSLYFLLLKGSFL